MKNNKDLNNKNEVVNSKQMIIEIDYDDLVSETEDGLTFLESISITRNMLDDLFDDLFGHH